MITNTYYSVNKYCFSHAALHTSYLACQCGQVVSTDDFDFTCRLVVLRTRRKETCCRLHIISFTGAEIYQGTKPDNIMADKTKAKFVAYIIYLSKCRHLVKKNIYSYHV